MSSCWIGVAAARHVSAAVAGGFAMFAHGRHEAARRVLPGDWVAYYAPREGIDEGDAVRAFVAIGEVLPGDPAERPMAPGVTGWYRAMRWLDARTADVYPLLEKLSFVTDRRHWGMHFRRSLFRVEAVDFALVAAAMGVAEDYRQSQ
jgi:hypothetical protein